MTIDNNPISRIENLVIQELGSELLIYDLELNKAYSLNETSTLVWQMCDGQCSIADINRQLNSRLKTPFSEAIVWLALDQLRKNDLLINGEKIDSQFNGLSRREVIKSVGFASMVALPLISSLVAPKAVSAQSVCTAPGMGGAGAMFGTCLDVSEAVCLTNCNGPFSGVSLICCSGAATAENCTPSGANVFCNCFCT